jgi:hypothetical protein
MHVGYSLLGFIEIPTKSMFIPSKLPMRMLFNRLHKYLLTY